MPHRLLVLVLFANVVCAADPVAARSLPLPGEWQFRLDRTDEGVKAHWELADKAPSDGWRNLRVPGCWEDQGVDYNGIAWYRCTVTVPADHQGPAFLVLPVVDESDTTWFNGVKVGATTKNWTEPRRYRIEADVLRPGAANSVMMRVVDNYGNGGLSSGSACLVLPGAIAGGTVRQANPGETALDIIPADPAAFAKAWTYGWRDEGTTDTRMGYAASANACDGQPALNLDVRFPNSAGEYVQCRLPAQMSGSDWHAAGRDYLAFTYRSQVAGELRLNLTPAGFTWTKKTGSRWDVAIVLKRSEAWTRVVVPFSFFTIEDPHKVRVLPDPDGLNVLSIGYRNNELQSAGRIELARFAVGSFAQAPETIALDTAWRAAPDPEHCGLAAGWQKPGFDDAAWDWLPVGSCWEVNGKAWNKLDGVVWFRQNIAIPAEWGNRPLELSLGQVADFQDGATVFWNGSEISTVANAKKDPGVDATVPAAAVQPGWATVAVRITDAGSRGGLIGKPFALAAPAAEIRLRERGDSGPGVAPQDFDMGSRLGRAIDLVVRIPRATGDGLRLALEVNDCFHRLLFNERVAIRDGQAIVALSEASSRLLFYSESLRVRGIIERADGTPVAACSVADTRMSYTSRDRRALPTVAETWEETTYGRLRLVDVIDAAADPATDAHPYKEGGIRQSWVGRRAYNSWEQGVTLGELAGRRYRELGNNEWMGWRIGRNLKPHTAYVLRVIYPEDKNRYFVMNIDAGRNYQGTGFRSGNGPTDPFDPYPISGRLEAYDHLVVLDDKTWGSAGSRSVAIENGMWVYFFDIGRAYAGHHPAGPAVAELRLYEVGDVDAHLPRIDLPKGAPHRWLAMDWEREPEAPAEDAVAYARFLGINAISPSMLKWGSLAWWRTSLPLRQVEGVREPLPDGAVPAYDRYLAATKAKNLAFIPRIEPTGSEDIPQDQRAIGRDGKPAQPNRFATWCSDLTQPAVAAEFDTIVDELITSRIADNPQLAGLHWRIRSDRFPISYGAKAVAKFCADTKRAEPGTDDVTCAKWASTGEIKAPYLDWWHRQRLAFQTRVLERLQKARPDLRLWYYNWDPDGWRQGEIVPNAQDYTDWYDKNRASMFYDRRAAHQRQWQPEDYVRFLQEGARMKEYGGQPHHVMRTDLYKDIRGISVLAPVQWNYLADNAPYLAYWDSAQGAAVSILFGYEEKGRSNVQGDNYESSELTPGGPDFAMAYEVLSCFHVDPETITQATYTYGRGFIDRHRRFAQAFLALPAQKGRLVVEQPELRVRRYDLAGEVRLGIVHKGYQATSAAIRLPGPWPAGTRCRDLVWQREVPVSLDGDVLVLPLQLGAMELRSFSVILP